MARFFYFPNVIRFFTLNVLFTGFVAGAFAQTTYKISGFVREAGTELPLAGVNVAARLGQGTRSGSDGSFSLTVATTDSLRLSFSFVGYATVTTVVSGSSQNLTIHLTPGTELTEVVVRSTGNAGRLSNQTTMSRISISVEQLKKIPALLGEKDVLKVIQLLPGVQKGSEGNAGVYVRGGGPDQNLMLLDEAVVYNPSHLFGFFSVFNGDVLKSVSLTKGGFPAQYGGRLSSVIDLGTKDGNRERLHGEGSVGLIASRLTLEGPIGRRASFLVSGRYSYYGLLTQQLAKKSTQGSPDQTSFYDLNAKFSLDLSDRDQLSLSAYTGHDQFVGTRTANEARLKSGLAWGNTTASLRWKRVFSEKLFTNTALLYSGYELNVSNQDAVLLTDKTSQVYQLHYASSIRDVSVKTDWEVYAGPHQLRMGLQSTLHRFTPSAVVVASATATLSSGQEITALESGIYAEDEWKLGERLRLNPGLRLSDYRQNSTHFLRPEPRLSLAYGLPRAWALKGSYAKMNQYVHLLSNTGTGLPTDLWVPSTDRLPPQQSEQLAAGIAKDFLTKTGESTGLSLTLEGYAKTMTNLISYREGASSLLPTGNKAGASRWEDDVTAGRGQSYGTEVLLQKRRGRFSGWAGYTLSWTTWQFAELNNGQPFHPRHDRRHDVSLVGIYELTPRIRVSGTWVYGSGQALTVPVARYAVNLNDAALGTTKPKTVREYSEKNGFRGEAYHRLDLSLQFIRQRAGRERIWELSVYNAYNRRNPFFYALEGKKDAGANTSHTVLYRYSLFSAIPSLSYSFKL